MRFDRWYSEQDLGDGKDGGPIDRALKRLREHGHVFEQDGATWFRATEFGDEKDRVVVRANGQKTYFASDIAYHLDKRERGFDLLVTILGADHHGYVARVRAGLAAMGEPPESLQVPLVQFVTLFKGGEKVPMGKREAQFVTLRDLRTEVGNDAARFIYVMRSNDQPLDFDLELAKKQSNDNPVYYVQYAHARIASVLKQAAERGLPFDQAAGLEALASLGEPAELALMREISRWPEVVRLGAEQRAPHLVVHYLRELAQAFHACYAALQFIVDDAKAAERPARADRRGAPGAAERARDPRRLGARDDVMVARDYKRSRGRREGFSGWTGLFIGLVAGLAVGFGFYLFDPRVPKEPEAGQKADAGAEPASASESAAEEPPERYDFYQMLPNFEVVVPEKEVVMPRDAPEAAESKGAYVLQAGSYKKFEDADRVRAQLALQGIESNVQRVAIDNDTWHRVRIGPISDPAELNRVRQRLKEAEVDFLVVKVGD